MKSKLMHETAGQRTYAVVFDKGDEVTRELLQWAGGEAIGAARIAAIGGFRQATLGYFDRMVRDYRRIQVREQVEVMSLLGNLSVLRGGGAKLHVHAVLGRSDGTALGGHLIEGHVWPTLEMFVTTFPAALERAVDAETTLPLIALSS